MNRYKTAALIITVQFGSAILILPGIMFSIQPISFAMILFSCLVFYMFSSYLVDDTFLHVENTKNVNVEGISRWPMEAYTYQVYGSCFSRFAVYTQIILCSFTTIALILVAAETLQTICPLNIIVNNENQLRVWTVIVVVFLILPSFYGTFNELGNLTLLCFGSALLCEVCIVTASILVYSSCSSVDMSNATVVLPTDNLSNYELFVFVIGEMIFLTSGLIVLLPNFIVTISKREDIKIAIAMSSIGIFVLFFVAALIPNVLLKDCSQIGASVLSTLSSIPNATDISGLKTVIIIGKVAIILHLALESVLVLNPVHLFVEEKFEVPKEFGWKRVTVRCKLLALVCLVGVIVPNFSNVISWIGGIPLFLHGFLVPVAIYVKITRQNWLKYFSLLLCLFLFVLMMNVNFVNLYVMIEKST